ncbi:MULTISPECIES: phage holin family protein [Streptomyces]|uniref:Transporter n=1 Tax=Streptomyces albidoflavus TaxID=1886 RepID=A0AB37XD26_9ACTN|nr:MULTISPECIES: phage holin family protein [Streptomyces]AWL33633.1 phage holin family protein [Streptomyces sp. SM17]RZE40498.1 transporter [Streptomyces albidoflavus]
MSAPVGADRSLGQLVASATAELSALVHDEIALAKKQLKQDVQRGLIGSAVGIAALTVLIFSLPMLSFALAYGFRTWTGWNMAICFLLSFAVNVLVALLLGLIALVFVKKAKKGKGPQKTVASAKQTAAVLQNAKPHPRPEPAGALPTVSGRPYPAAAVEAKGAHLDRGGEGGTAVARSSS